MSQQFKVELFADFGTEEPFVARIGLGLIDILNATNFEKREQINDAILEVLMDGLFPAFQSLKIIRETETQKDGVPRLTLIKNYQDFYKYLWVAYKDRMQKAALLLGFNIGFLFEKEEGFQKGSQEFLEQHPSNIGIDFLKMLGNERKSWQNVLSTLRNQGLEHKQIESKHVERFFTLKDAEKVFENCWQAIEDILIVLLRTGLPLDRGIDIAELPENKRNSACPKRFAFIKKF